MKRYKNNYPDLSKCDTQDLLAISKFHKIILNYLKMGDLIKGNDPLGYVNYMGAIYYKSGLTENWITTLDNHKTIKLHKTEDAAKIYIQQQSLGS